ncbi:hypothetical protein ABENE_17340 [Asticcacaulis benevestitus DSM 16100 = ATCC BAA-896]|uniref:Uncharacterized protein n=1 Tax=Asticcacaulis benevestitus DSM 16100 = ATCC BAA-896 TaxID=1121022 RepID=V4NZT0_9CAUL|nr:hypothetical protein ABENE_17340 [Asticcacaulis benevestitus DSM 16100 = ATCC BAA-896]
MVKNYKAIVVFAQQVNSPGNKLVFNPRKNWYLAVKPNTWH